MSAFQSFGIKHLSPSALNCWIASPGLYCLRYLKNVRDEGNAAMWRGDAVEAGLERILRGMTVKDAKQAAEDTFEARAMGEASDEVEAERKLFPKMVERAADWVADMLGAKNLHPLAATQLKVEARLDGVSIPVIGYLDYTFFDGPDIDCKSTKACPSKPRPDHLRQIALYWHARQRPQALLYLTDKRSAFYCPTEDELAEALSDLADAARSLERFLSVMPNADTAVRCLPMDRDNFRWSAAAQAKITEMAGAF